VIWKNWAKRSPMRDFGVRNIQNCFGSSVNLVLQRAIVNSSCEVFSGLRQAFKGQGAKSGMHPSFCYLKPSPSSWGEFKWKENKGFRSVAFCTIFKGSAKFTIIARNQPVVSSWALPTEAHWSSFREGTVSTRPPLEVFAIAADSFNSFCAQRQVATQPLESLSAKKPLII